MPVSGSRSSTFSSALPANTFSGNTAGSGGPNCYNDGGSIVGTCEVATLSPTPPTLSPTPSATPVPWTGSDLAAHVRGAADGTETWLAAGTHAWASEVACSSKTVTVAGAGEGATILDAGAARHFFALSSGCTLVLRGLTLRNGKASGSWPANRGGAIDVADGATLDASSVEFKSNSAEVRAAPPRCSP